MFGVIVASLDNVDEDEKARYQQVYCGLCHSLKRRYGQLSRFCVNYDMAFLALLLESLHEAGEAREQGRCAVHPTRPHWYACGRFIDYAADMSLVLAYHKCIDDWEDDKNAPSLAYSKAIERAYRATEARYPFVCSTTAQMLTYIRELEAQSLADQAESQLIAGDAKGEEGVRATQLERADGIARSFGAVMAVMFAHHGGHWEEELGMLGYELGRFVYFMDAAIDRGEDGEQNAYNPFNICSSSAHDVSFILNDAIGAAVRVFEKLPLENDLHLMRSVLYAGVWQKLMLVQRERGEDDVVVAIHSAQSPHPVAGSALLEDEVSA